MDYSPRTAKLKRNMIAASVLTLAAIFFRLDLSDFVFYGATIEGLNQNMIVVFLAGTSMYHGWLLFLTVRVNAVSFVGDILEAAKVHTDYRSDTVKPTYGDLEEFSRLIHCDDEEQSSIMAWILPWVVILKFCFLDRFKQRPERATLQLFMYEMIIVPYTLLFAAIVATATFFVLQPLA